MDVFDFIIQWGFVLVHDSQHKSLFKIMNAEDKTMTFQLGKAINVQHRNQFFEQYCALNMIWVPPTLEGQTCTVVFAPEKMTNRGLTNFSVEYRGGPYVEGRLRQKQISAANMRKLLKMTKGVNAEVPYEWLRAARAARTDPSTLWPMAPPGTPSVLLARANAVCGDMSRYQPTPPIHIMAHGTYAYVDDMVLGHAPQVITAILWCIHPGFINTAEMVRDMAGLEKSVFHSDCERVYTWLVGRKDAELDLLETHFTGLPMHLIEQFGHFSNTFTTWAIASIEPCDYIEPWDTSFFSWKIDTIVPLFCPEMETLKSPVAKLLCSLCARTVVRGRTGWNGSPVILTSKIPQFLDDVFLNTNSPPIGLVMTTLLCSDNTDEMVQGAQFLIRSITGHPKKLPTDSIMPWRISFLPTILERTDPAAKHIIALCVLNPDEQICVEQKEFAKMIYLCKFDDSVWCNLFVSVFNLNHTVTANGVTFTDTHSIPPFDHSLSRYINYSPGPTRTTVLYLFLLTVLPVSIARGLISATTIAQRPQPHTAHTVNAFLECDLPDEKEARLENQMAQRRKISRVFQSPRDVSLAAYINVEQFCCSFDGNVWNADHAEKRWNRALRRLSPDCTYAPWGAYASTLSPVSWFYKSIPIRMSGPQIWKCTIEEGYYNLTKNEKYSAQTRSPKKLMLDLATAAASSMDVEFLATVAEYPTLKFSAFNKSL